MEYIIAFVMKECCEWGGRRGAHPVLLARSQNGMGPKAVFMRDFSVPSTTEGLNNGNFAIVYLRIVVILLPL